MDSYPTYTPDIPGAEINRPARKEDTIDATEKTCEERWQQRAAHV